MNLESAALVQTEATLYPWETPRYQEAKVAQLHKHLLSKHVPKVGKRAMNDNDSQFLTLVNPVKVRSDPTSRMGSARSGSTWTTSTTSRGSSSNASVMTLPRRSPSTRNLVSMDALPFEGWGHFVDVNPKSQPKPPPNTYRHFLHREIHSNNVESQAAP